MVRKSYKFIFLINLHEKFVTKKVFREELPKTGGFLVAVPDLPCYNDINLKRNWAFFCGLAVPSFFHSRFCECFKWRDQGNG